MDWGHRSFAVGPDGIRGSGVILRRSGDVISGFVFGKATRLRISDSRLSGVFAGISTDIKLSSSDREVQLRGDLPDLGRSVVVSSEWKLEVYSTTVAMNVLRGPSGVFRGEIKVGQRYSGAELRLTECSPRILWQRPELALVLAIAPIAR
ncbi:MAG: hypothetical protein V3T05_07860 [Myxococcota bacterium]